MRARPIAWLFFSFALFFGAGCQFLVDFDRGRLVDAGPDAPDADAAADQGVADAGTSD